MKFHVLFFSVFNFHTTIQQLFTCSTWTLTGSTILFSCCEEKKFNKDYLELKLKIQERNAFIGFRLRYIIVNYFRFLSFLLQRMWKLNKVRWIWGKRPLKIRKECNNITKCEKKNHWMKKETQISICRKTSVFEYKLLLLNRRFFCCK